MSREIKILLSDRPERRDALSSTGAGVKVGWVTLTTETLCKFSPDWRQNNHLFSLIAVIFCWRSRRTNFPLEQEEEEEEEEEGGDGGADKPGRACTERGSSQVKMMGRMIRTEIG